MKKLLHLAAWPFLIAIVTLVFVPVLSSTHSSNHTQLAHATGLSKGQFAPHPRPQYHSYHKVSGADRTHLATLPLLAGPITKTRTNSNHPEGALISNEISPATTTTIFFDNFEHGSPGWTTLGDNNKTSSYPNGHDFWNLIQNPQTLAVPNAVNPTLVTYPDSAGMLPAAYSGIHAWWYGDNPTVDPINPSNSSMTYMGNQFDWPPEHPKKGGTSNGPNSGSLLSPSIDLTSVPNATLTFATWWEIESLNPAHFDLMYIDVSTDGGNNWSNLGVLNPSTNPTGGANPYSYTTNGIDTVASWRIASANLTPYVGLHIKLRFRFDTIDGTDNGFRGWFIDNVGVFSTSTSGPQIGSLTPNSGLTGDTITISGTGFGIQQNKSKVTFNGMMAAVQSWSDTKIMVSVPIGATSGPLFVTVNGVRSAPVNFTVNAQVSLSISTTSPGVVVSFNGQGFGAGEPVAMYFDGVTGTLLDTIIADGSGRLSTTSLTIPDTTTGNHLIVAVGQNSHTTGGSVLSIIPAISLSTNTVHPMQSVILSGRGFNANELISVQLNNGSFFGYTNSDSSGNFTETITMPSSNIVQGQYILTAAGELVAETTLTFKPAIFFYQKQNQGGPGSSIYLNGAAFNLDEPVEIYWGTISGLFEGKTTTDGVGNLQFSFTAPTGLAPGAYPITIVRSNQTPMTVTTNFRILTPKITGPGGFHSGQHLILTLTGFQANELVTISWNANGGQVIATAQLDFLGAGQVYTSPPPAPGGSYLVTAVGNSSGLQATVNVNLGQGILLGGGFGNPGSTINVTGGGYTANEAVNVYFQKISNGSVQTTTDAVGNFTVALTLPRTYNPTVQYFVHAISVSGSEHAQARFIFAPVFFSFNYCCPGYGELITPFAQGFASNETVNVIWNYQQPGQVKAATLAVDSNGFVIGSFTIPSSPANQGNVQAAAIGTISKLKVIFTVYERPGLVLQPSTGPAGTSVKVLGGSFNSAESVTISFQGTNVATVTTNTKGAFTTKFVIPTSAVILDNTMQAVGSTSGLSATATFTATPTLLISPATGTSGTAITVTGSQYSTSSLEIINWYDPSSGNYTVLGTVTSSSTGTFTIMVTAPKGLTSGSIYYVVCDDSPTGQRGQAAFTAQ